MENLLELVDRHHAVKQPRTVLPLHCFGLERRLTQWHIAGNCFEEVVMTELPLDAAVLVDHQDDMTAGLLDMIQHLQSWHSAGHKRRLLHRPPEVKASSR